MSVYLRRSNTCDCHVDVEEPDDHLNRSKRIYVTAQEEAELREVFAIPFQAAQKEAEEVKRLAEEAWEQERQDKANQARLVVAELALRAEVSP